MRIHNLYVDDQGETHFRDLEVEWTREGPGGKLSATQPARGIIFRETPGSYDYDWHPAPRRQYIINLDGGVRITVSDGEVREIGAGEILLVEDTHGKGHISQAIAGQMRHSVFITLEQPAPPPVYSRALVAGGMVFVSDNGSTDPGSGAIVGIAIQEQTAQCLRSIRAVLEAAGSGLDRAVNATVILNDEATSVA